MEKLQALIAMIGCGQSQDTTNKMLRKMFVPCKAARVSESPRQVHRYRQYPINLPFSPK